MSVKKSTPVRGACLVLVAAVLWGTVGPAQVLASSPVTPVALGCWRLLVGGLVLGIFTVRPRRTLGSARVAVRPLLICAFSTGIYQAAFLTSVTRTGAALATVIALGAAPASTGACARWVTGERIDPPWLAGTVAAVAGCALLLDPGGAHVDFVGLLLAVAAGSCYGIYTVFAKRLAAAHKPADLPMLSAVILLVGCLPMLPWLIADGLPAHDAPAIALIAWLGVAATAAAYWLFTAGLALVKATTAATLSLAEPMGAALIGVLLLHENISGSAWAGCVLIFGAMLTMSLLPTTRRSLARGRDLSKSP
ncbi:DMT family transporter [Nocardia sp. SC052]|uniref:DMT family transporter n=1 Tax=Nocardia sichangensis TaxID=3385975 RepID=UPI0039A320C4